MNSHHIFEMNDNFGENSEHELSNFESQIGFHLPEDYRAFLMKTNGGVPRKRFFQHLNFGVSLIDFYCGIFPGNHKDIQRSTDRLRCMVDDGTFDEVIYIATDPGGVAICIGVAHSNLGNIYLFDHDSNEEGIILLKIANSFTEFFNSCYETAEEAELVYDKSKVED